MTAAQAAVAGFPPIPDDVADEVAALMTSTTERAA